MKLTAKVKLQPTDEQHQALHETLARANEACNYISEIAWKEKTFRQFSLHHLVYHDIRDRFDLGAQVTVRCIAKVADAYKLDRKRKRSFRPDGAIAFDSRMLSWKLHPQQVSIWTLDGREKMPFACGPRQLELLQGHRGESDLCLIRGEFYLFCSCEVETPDPIDVDGFLGVDLGVVNIAADSDGKVHSAKHVNNVRHRHRRLRKRLQKKRTKSARRRLKKLSGKEKRFATDANHCISKSIVEKAERTGRGIALEELTGIRFRIRARKPQRATLHSWSFAQLGAFLSYKAQLAGVPVAFIDPAYTSQTCPVCGHVDKRNRSDQSTFSCVSCGHSGLADTIAAINISRRAVVNRPNVSDAQTIAQCQGQAPPLAVG